MNVKEPVANPGSDPGSAHIFSVDVEEYFQVNAFDRIIPTSAWPGYPSRIAVGVNRLLDLLALHGASATFFTLGWIARNRPAIVRRIAEAGHEIASHGWWHRRVNTLTPTQLRVELRDSKQVLEDLSGAPVLGFRAPSFSITPGCEWAFDVLLEEGYGYDSSLFPIRRAGYGYPGAPTAPHTIRRAGGMLLELPLATRSIAGLRMPAAGGGYLRQLPYSVTAGAVRQAERHSVPAMVYIHPWELDAEQPRMRVGWVTRLRHYRGLQHVMPRVNRLLETFRFTSVQRSTHSTIVDHLKSSAWPAAIDT